MKAAIILILASLTAGPAYSWRETGHYAICQIAWDHLSQQSQRRIAHILGSANYAETCTWPDQIRKLPDWEFTYPWHFINLDDGEKYFDAAAVNEEGDVLYAATRAIDILQDPSASTIDKKHSLRFFGHFVGDMHQPLHVGKRQDLGGNRITVTWFGATEFESAELLQVEVPLGACGTLPMHSVNEATGTCIERMPASSERINLHKVWDLLMLERFIQENRLVPLPGDSESMHKAYAQAIDLDLTPAVIADWRRSHVQDWAMESLAERERAYSVGDGHLGEDYYRRNIDYLNQRLLQAGYRLSAVLEMIFNPEAADPHRLKFFELAQAELKARLREVGLTW